MDDSLRAASVAQWDHMLLGQRAQKYMRYEEIHNVFLLHSSLRLADTGRTALL
jgi:hypothetical protein